jgi:hypothetical protein
MPSRNARTYHFAEPSEAGRRQTRIVLFLPAPDLDDPPSQRGIVRVQLGDVHVPVRLVEDEQLEEPVLEDAIELGRLRADAEGLALLEALLAHEQIGELLQHLLAEGGFGLLGDQSLENAQGLSAGPVVGASRGVAPFGARTEGRRRCGRGSSTASPEPSRQHGRRKAS